MKPSSYGKESSFFCIGVHCQISEASSLLSVFRCRRSYLPVCVHVCVWAAATCNLTLNCDCVGDGNMLKMVYCFDSKSLVKCPKMDMEL